MSVIKDSLRIATIALIAAVPSPAAWANFSATTDAVIQFCCVDSNNNSGPAPVSSSAEIRNLTGSIGRATADAKRGEVRGDVIATSNVIGAKPSSRFEASATFSDIVISNNVADAGGFQVGEDIPVSFRYHLAANQRARGSLLFVGGFSATQLEFRVTVRGSTETGIVRWKLPETSGQQLLGTHGMFALVPLGIPFAVTLTLVGDTTAFTTTSGGSTMLGAALAAGGVPNPPTSLSDLFGAPLDAQLQPGSIGQPGLMQNGLVAPLAETADTNLVFELPAGLTANSESMGIVDNRWIFAPVPEPSRVLLFVAGLGVIGWACRGRLCNLRQLGAAPPGANSNRRAQASVDAPAL